MKERITVQQWNKLSEEHKQVFRDEFTQNIGFVKVRLLSIGQLIGFLGDSLIQISNGQGNGWAVNHTNCVLAQDPEEELIDALWNAVIIRVKNENENNK